MHLQRGLGFIFFPVRRENITKCKINQLYVEVEVEKQKSLHSKS